MSSRHSPSNDDRRDASELETAVPTVTQRGSGLRGSVWFAFKALEIRLRFIVIIIGVGLVIGYWDTIKNHWDKWTRPVGAGVTVAAGQEFYCPMHPSVVRDKPDPGGAIPKCPICGMPLSKRQKGEASQLPEGVISRVQFSPYRVELAGIKTAEATLRPLSMDVRAVGYVGIDERKLSRIVVRVDGYVEKLYVDESFQTVTEGEPLAEIYSPDLYSAAQELLIAARGGGAQLREIAREKLRLLGVADSEIDEILRAGKAESRLIIRAPHGGHVFDKRIVEGDSVKAGQMLFEVADLSTVWIEGEVYEKDAALLEQGQDVTATVDALPGREFAGRIELVHPHVETATRTMRVRFVVENTKHALRPGMFATVSLKTPMQAIEPFKTQLAAQAIDVATDRVARQPSEAIAEPTQNQRATTPVDEKTLIAMQKFCPVTGAKLGSMGESVRDQAAGRTVFLCCAGCVEKLAARPDYYVRRLSTVSTEGVLAVPEQSVIDTGKLQIVYVEREPGLFEGVPVTLGSLADGYYPVIEGLLPGDRVAAAGAFLVDAETRLNPAAGSSYFGASGSPSSGGTTSSPSVAPSQGSGSNGAPPNNATIKALANLAKLSLADRERATAQRVCPITDLPLGSMGVPIKMTVGGTPLFLCCDGCKDTFNKDPQAALSKIQRNQPQPSR